MNRIVNLLLVVLIATKIYAQAECPEPTEVEYKKVMSSAFAKEYEECPVIINAEYFNDGYLKNYRKPSKLKKMYFFQCISIGGKAKSASLSNEMSGDFFVIDKEQADQVLKLIRGDKIKITGTTFTQKYMGTTLNVFFVVSKIEKKN